MDKNRQFFLISVFMFLTLFLVGFFSVFRLTLYILVSYLGATEGLQGLGQILSSFITGTVGGLVGTLIALVINLKIGKKWREEFAPSEEEGNYERIRLTCLSFLVFLVLLWGLIVLIARL